MAIPPGGHTPQTILKCTVSTKNEADDLLYTLVSEWFLSDNTVGAWMEVQGNMWSNYNETFRDLLITWLRVIQQIRGI
jgi:hypothetical protein